MRSLWIVLTAWSTLYVPFHLQLQVNQALQEQQECPVHLDHKALQVHLELEEMMGNQVLQVA